MTSEGSYLADMDRITSRMNRVSRAKSLIRDGAHREALEVLRAVRQEYDEESMRKMVDFLIRDLESRLASG